MTTTTVYKLTDQNMQTHNGFQWELGRKYDFPGTGPLCTAGWAHAYVTPQLAMLLHPMHVPYTPIRLFRAEAVVGLRDGDIKIGCSSLTLLDEITIPEITTEQRVTFAIQCSLEVYDYPPYVTWAEAWLAGFRTARTTYATAAGTVQVATRATRIAALAAVYATDAARATNVDQAAVYAASAVAATVDAADAAAVDAVWRRRQLDLPALAQAALLPWNPNG